MADSTVAGPLPPDVGSPAPLEGQGLNQFLQGWIVGITGFNSAMVRPRWQPEPANIPSEGNCWLAFGITSRTFDAYGMTFHDPTADAGLGADNYQRHETLNLLLSFYDLGVNGLADYYAALLIDGVQIDQNRELLNLNGFGLTETKDPVVAPSLFKERWQYRVDVQMSLRRQVRRTYPVRNIIRFSGTLTADTPHILTENITV